MDRYDYNSVPTFTQVRNQVRGDSRRYIRECMEFEREEDRAFMEACLEAFCPTLLGRLLTGIQLMAIRKAIELLPPQQWRQGQSTHEMAIWPHNPDLRKIVGDGYWGPDRTVVCQSKHGAFNWFCIMAWGAINDAKRKREGSHAQ